MSFKQIIFPNLDDKKLVVNYQGKPLLDWFLWCLAVAQKTFNVAPFAATAQIAWNWNNTKHQDRNLPDGCFVPIWWTGGTGNYGHVAVAKRSGNRIQIWSSPYRHKPYFDYFEGELNATIDNVSRIYGVAYAGWTETMNTTRVIEWVQDKTNEEIAAEVWQNKWGNGQDRINRLTNAGYDWRAVQALIDKEVGKPVEKPQEVIKVEEKPQEPVKVEEKPEPKPEPRPEEKPIEKPIEEPVVEETVKKPEMEPEVKQLEVEKEPKKEEKIMDKTPTPELTDDKIKQFNDAYQASLSQASGIIEEVGSGFDFSQKTKMIAYLLGDFLLLAGAITPQVILAVMSLNDKNLTAFGTALASILATLGSQILLIFKLMKKKK